MKYLLILLLNFIFTAPVYLNDADKVAKNIYKEFSNKDIRLFEVNYIDIII